jgi:hypothetical protein
MKDTIITAKRKKTELIMLLFVSYWLTQVIYMQ